MTDKTMIGAFHVTLPQDLVAEAKRVSSSKPQQLGVEGWRNSWLTRVSAWLVGKDR